MIKDDDMNILAMFCLNALSENDLSHSYILKSCIDEGIGDMHVGTNSTSSIFSRINYLLEVWEPKADHMDKKGELLIVLISSFYLNLARNDSNI